LPHDSGGCLTIMREIPTDKIETAATSRRFLF
jgi:hypothetical protein